MFVPNEQMPARNAYTCFLSMHAMTMTAIALNVAMQEQKMTTPSMAAEVDEE